ncbi:MAG TPA: MerR family transcriptional regulator [Bacteroidales bacterium]|nr:MerR family transcriptional regulator [Bacteroidales bacterium]
MPYREKKVEKLYYQIGEVADMFSEPVSTIRFWEKEFDILRPKKNNKGNRLFMQEDIRNLKLIHHLLRERGMTLEGAKKYLRSNHDEVDYRLEIADALRNIRAMLVDIRDEIK